MLLSKDDVMKLADAGFTIMQVDNIATNTFRIKLLTPEKPDFTEWKKVIGKRELNYSKMYLRKKHKLLIDNHLDTDRDEKLLIENGFTILSVYEISSGYVILFQSPEQKVKKELATGIKSHKQLQDKLRPMLRSPRIILAPTVDYQP